MNYTGNVTQTAYGNVHGDAGSLPHPMLIVFIVLGSGSWEELTKACIIVCVSCVAGLVWSVISSAFDS